MNDDNFLITGGAGLDKNLTGYSHILFTDMSFKMNKLYGIDVILAYQATRWKPQNALTGKSHVPLTEETVRKLRGASMMNIASSHQANAVIQYFINLTAKLGQFGAFLCEEVASASNLSQTQVDYALKESVFRVTKTNYLSKEPKLIMELTDKLIPILVELPEEVYFKK